MNVEPPRTSEPPPPLPVAPPDANPPPPERRPHAQLIAAFQAQQRRQLWVEGALYGLAAALVLLVAAGFFGQPFPWLGRWLLLLAPVIAAAVAVALGVVLAVSRVGDELKAARLLGERLPSLQLDVLAAVELLREAKAGQHSEALAAAFVQQIDERAKGVRAQSALDARRTRRAGAALGAVLLVSLAVVGALRVRWWSGLVHATQSGAQLAGPVRLEPVTGDIEITYRYPAYTGLAPRTLPVSTGEVTAPKGTEVALKTRADRDVTRAELVLGDERVPLQLEGTRDLSGTFVLKQSGSYHFELFRKNNLIARGPEVPVNAEADTPPQVRLTSPAEELEIDEGAKVTLKYEASDDYGLTSLELVYRLPGSAEAQRVKLRHDEGRRSKGQYVWDLAGVKLKPGQRVTYHVEAQDNDEVEGKKKGVSRTQVLKLYSAAEHRRAAVERVQKLWDRMVTHLADRLESNDRAKEKTAELVAPGQTTDQSGTQLAADLVAAARELAKERDAPRELIGALVNISDSFQRHVLSTADARRTFLRYQRMQSDLDMGRRLTAVVSAEISEVEKDILYLESLLDRQKLLDLQELGRQLQADRRELASLLEQFRQTKDEALQDNILREVQALRERMNELMRRMSELAKGIRDEHLNQEALRELMEERDFASALDEVEKLVREGKADEALMKLQQMAMEMDEMVESLAQAEEGMGDEEYRALAEKFQEFMDDLGKTTEAQKRVSDETKALRDRYKQQMQQRLKQRGQQLKDELLRKTEQATKSYQSLEPDQLSMRADRPLEEVRAELDNLKNALKVDDFDLAAEAAARAERASQELAGYAELERQRDEAFKNPEDVRRRSRETAERLRQDSAKVSDINQKLQQLFPQPGSMLSEADKQRLRSLSQEQRQLEKQADGLRRKMEEMSQMAPVFGQEAEEQMGQIGEHMGGAAQRMEMRDVSRGYGEQKAALEQLQQFEKQMKESSQRSGKGKGMPLPMFSSRRPGLDGRTQDKVEIPDEEQFQAPKEFRKDLLDAMKQGAPDKYKEQVKRYYEELVK